MGKGSKCQVENRNLTYALQCINHISIFEFGVVLFHCLAIFTLIMCQIGKLLFQSKTKLSTINFLWSKNNLLGIIKKRLLKEINNANLFTWS